MRQPPRGAEKRQWGKTPGASQDALEAELRWSMLVPWGLAWSLFCASQCNACLIYSVLLLLSSFVFSPFFFFCEKAKVGTFGLVVRLTRSPGKRGNRGNLAWVGRSRADRFSGKLNPTERCGGRAEQRRKNKKMSE